MRPASFLIKSTTQEVLTKYLQKIIALFNPQRWEIIFSPCPENN